MLKLQQNSVQNIIFLGKQYNKAMFKSKHVFIMNQNHKKLQNPLINFDTLVASQDVLQCQHDIAL